MSVYQILKELEETPGKNDKIAILEANKDNELLKKCLKLMLDDTLFYIKKVPEGNLNGQPDLTLEQAIGQLKALSDRKVTGNAAILYLDCILSGLVEDDLQVVKRIIKKDPNCGVQDKTVNKVWKGLVKETPYMRCSLDMGKINFPAIAQTKADGMFVNIIYPGNIESSEVSIISRNGKTVSVPCLENILSDNLHGYSVYHGELLVYDEDFKETLDRKTGNGFLNRKDRTPEEDARIYVKLWDWVPVEDWEAGQCNITNERRFEELFSVVEPIHSHVRDNDYNVECAKRIKLIDYKHVRNIDEAYAFYQTQIEKGEEGAILKNLDGIWKNHTSPNCVKMKEEKDCDLLIIGSEPHKKDAGKIGALVCESADGKLVVGVGSGLTDADREMLPSHYIGKIATIKYNEKIQSKGKKTLSLFLPRLVEIREDKTEADTVEKIK